MNRTALKAALCIVGLACLAGCQSNPTIYQWGSYQGLIYDMYIHPGKAGPDVQIAQLTEDIKKAELEGKRVPPGVHAHLGYLYYMQGNVSAALAEFATEKEQFPESATFIDGMVARLKKSQRK